MQLQRIIAPLTAALLALTSLSSVLAQDPNPTPEVVEQAVCGSTIVSGTINQLPAAIAGRCPTSSDWVLTEFEPTACASCSNFTISSGTNQSISPSEDVASQPLPPVSFPSEGPFPTPPAQQNVTSIMGVPDASSPGHYCVYAFPNGGQPAFQCANLGPLAPFVAPFGPIALVNVSSTNVGPTPGEPAGGLGNSPAEHV